MIVINMPGGAVQYLTQDEVLWFRKAFDSEWSGTTMVRLLPERIYSSESVAELEKKFAAAGVAMTEFAAPDDAMELVVSIQRVRQVEPANHAIHNDRARSLLVFSPTISLAVRETPDEARKKIGLDAGMA